MIRSLALLGVLALGSLTAACGPEPAAVQVPATVTTLAIGDPVPTYWVEDADGGPTERTPDAEAAATVIWFSSCTCRCVADCEQRIRDLLARYEGKDVRFVSIDSNPHDTAADIVELRKRLGSPYAIDRDVNGLTMRLLGIKASASVAVLDREGRLRYRGAIDDDRYEPQVSYVHGAVDAILAGSDVDPVEETSYGCLYPLPGN